MEKWSDVYFSIERKTNLLEIVYIMMQFVQNKEGTTHLGYGGGAYNVPMSSKGGLTVN